MGSQPGQNGWVVVTPNSYHQWLAEEQRANREWWNHNQASSSRAGPSYMETPTTIHNDQTRMLDNWAQDSENLAQQWKDFAETCKAAKAPCQKPTPVRRSPNRDPRKKEQIKPKGVKEIDDLNIKAEGLYKQIQQMPKITMEVIFVPAYEPKKSPAGARIQLALYEEANRRIDEIFPITNTSKSYATAYNEWVFWRRKCIYEYRHFAPEEECHGCNYHSLRLNEEWLKDRLQAQ